MTTATKSWKHVDGKRALLSALAAAGVLAVPRIAAAHDDDWMASTWIQALGAPTSSSFVPTATPRFIPRYLALRDPTGRIGSFQPNGPTDTSTNAFFTPFGNGRSCFSCHQPQDGWALTPDTVLATFLATDGRDAMFAPVDGADCPDLAQDDDDDDDHGRHHRHHRHGHHHRNDGFVGARRQLFSRANFRIFLPVPAGAEWTVSVVRDPFGCETSAQYGLPAGFLSMYRRPLPSANTSALAPQGLAGASDIFPKGFNIMWDAREPDLESQFVNALKGHAQVASIDDATAAPLAAQGVTFQNGLFTAQVSDDRAGDLDAAGALGGPQILSTLPPGIPSVFATPPQAFTMFTDWLSASGRGHRRRAARESIARGEAIFNGAKTFDITDVPGLNDVVGRNPQPGFCGFCHNNGERGNDFFLDPKRLGIEDNSCAPPNTCTGDPHDTPGARVALPPPYDMPLFSFICPRDSNGQSTIPFFSNPVDADGNACPSGDCGYDEFLTTDPGLGLITGKCEDLGKMKVPILRGLAARAPYFHGGNAATLDDVVDFYDRRFAIGFTEDEKRDLIAFLNAL